MMRKTIALTLLPALFPAMLAALLVSAMAATLSPAGAEEPLQRYAWQGRPLLVFAPSTADRRFQSQRAMLAAAQEGLKARDAPVILVAGEEALINGAPAPFSAEALRRSYGVPADAFAVLLVGKDTGVKLRSGRIVRPQLVFELIDQMPMRREEMRRGERS